MTIRVKDADDQNPIFTKDIYRASVSETTKLTVSFSLSRNFHHYYYCDDDPFIDNVFLITKKTQLLSFPKIIIYKSCLKLSSSSLSLG